MSRALFRLALTLVITSLASTGYPVAAAEITPFAGYRLGGSFIDNDNDTTVKIEDAKNWGFIIGLDEEAITQYEFLFSHQSSRLNGSADPANPRNFDLDTNYFHVGGTRFWREDNLTPFISGGLGLTYMTPGLSGLDSETRLSMSLGGGFKWYPADQLGLRFEVRGYGTLADGGGSLFCDHGQCVLSISGDLLVQYEANLGVIVKF
jgi:opacity protein-like surface antigen